jgi:hypothetical protein
MSELKPCPFCGNKNISNDELRFENEVISRRFTCSDCNVLIMDISAEHWNTRPIEDALNKRIAELEKEITDAKDYFFDPNSQSYFYFGTLAEMEKQFVHEFELREDYIAELEAALKEIITYSEQNYGDGVGDECGDIARHALGE